MSSQDANPIAAVIKKLDAMVEELIAMRAELVAAMRTDEAKKTVVNISIPNWFGIELGLTPALATRLSNAHLVPPDLNGMTYDQVVSKLKSIHRIGGAKAHLVARKLIELSNG